MKEMPFAESRGEEKITFWWEQSSASQYFVFSLLGKADFHPSPQLSVACLVRANQTLNGNHNVPAEPFCQSRRWGTAALVWGDAAASGLWFHLASFLPHTSSHSPFPCPATIQFSCCSLELFRYFQSLTLMREPKSIFITRSCFPFLFLSFKMDSW